MGPFLQGAAAAMPPGPGGPPPQAGPGGLPLPPGVGGQAGPEYATETQADGTVLLRVKMPDGSLGPVVKIVSVPKPSLNGPPTG